MTVPEQWLPIPGWEGLYEVSDHGQVRSLDRLVEYPDGRPPYVRPGRIMMPRANKDGRRRVSLCRDARYTHCLIAPLVLAAFVGPRPGHLDCCHNDGDPTNDYVGNLRWATRSENNLDAVKHGTHWKAKRSRCLYGHLFEGANLLTHRGHRVCRACRRARRTVRRYGLEDFQAEADEHYALVMAGTRRSSARRDLSRRS